MEFFRWLWPGDGWEVVKKVRVHSRDPDTFDATLAQHRVVIIDSLIGLLPAEPKISECILCLLSRISSNLLIRTPRRSELHFALPRQLPIPISS